MTLRRLLELACLVAAVGVLSPDPARSQDFARVAPYRDIVWPEDTPDRPRILLDGAWFELLSINGTSVADVIAASRAAFGDLWQKRFDEDLSEVLTAMGSPPGPTVTLGLRDPETGRISTLDAPMTSANRAALMRAKRARESPGITFLPQPPPEELTGTQIANDLDALLAEMEARWAYLRATEVDYRTAIEELKERGANGMAHADYGMEVLRIVSMFVDGHATVGGFDVPDGELPFFIESTDDRFVAILRDRSSFVDPERPYITRIDGRPLEAWLDSAESFVPKASSQWMLRNQLDRVEQIGLMRDVMGIPSSDSIEVEVASENGGDTRRITLPVPDDAESPSRWPPGGSRIIDGDVGYLRLPVMNAAAVEEIATWMPRFRDTRGLVVDVRGNTGGNREALRALFPYVMDEDDAPVVVNASKYRLHPDYEEDHLGGSRFMYRESWTGWNAPGRAAIARFRETFRPEWTPPWPEFSEWHYLVMSRGTNPDAYVYGRPVIVLLDQNSFSATDIFVSAFKGWREVTLVGTPSGGGSARQVGVRLPISGLALNFASMASFQASGRLHDGNGTQPDVPVHPEPEYFLDGGRDNVLERALELLGGAPRP